MYASFTDAHDSNENHVSRRWIEQSLNRLNSIASGQSIAFPSELLSANPAAIMPAISDVISRGQRASVIDFGGNLGQLRLWLSHWLGLKSLDWTVVERSDFLHDSRIQENLPAEIRFIEDINLADPGSNILYFGSSLQYVEDLDASFGAFLSSRAPEWVVIADAMVGAEIPTFVTRQKYDDGFLVSKFRNMSEVQSFFEQAGYYLFSAWGSLNEKNRHYYPELGLPASHRIDFPLDISFKRVSV